MSKTIVRWVLSAVVVLLIVLAPGLISSATALALIRVPVESVVALAILAEAAPLVQERVALLGETPGMLGFLFTDASGLVHDDGVVEGLPADAPAVLTASVDALDRIPPLEWTHEVIQEALSGALIDGLGLKPRVAYTPLRVAVSGEAMPPDSRIGARSTRN